MSGRHIRGDEESQKDSTTSAESFRLTDYLEPGTGRRGPRQGGLVYESPEAQVEKAKEDPPETSTNIDQLLKDLVYKDHRLDHDLKKRLGSWIPGMMLGQIILMNVIFMGYLVAVMFTGLELDATVFIAYITTAFAEVVGLALVVTRYLFPEGGAGWNRE